MSMRLRESTGRAPRVLLLAFVLTAAWPFGSYNPRLELSYQTEIPAALNRARTPDGAEGWLSFLPSARPYVLRVTAGTRRHPSRPRSVRVAALSLARSLLESTDPDPLPRAEYGQVPHTSFKAIPPPERGPPCLG